MFIINFKFLLFTLLFILLTYVIMVFVAYVKKYYYKDYSRKDIYNSFDFFVKYLDRFYVNNIYYTIFGCFCFVFFNSL